MNLKLILLILLFILITSFANAQECIEGIDDVCDLNCIEVDYDCDENPRQEGRFFVDENEDVYDPFEHAQEQDDNPYTIPENSQVNGEYLETVVEAEKYVVPWWFYLAGSLLVILLIIAIYFIHHRISHSEKEFEKQMSQLIAYVRRLEQKGFNQNQIKKLFKEKAYDDKTIRLVFERLKPPI